MRIYYFQLLKTVKRSLIKLIQKHKKHWILKSPEPEKRFHSNRQSQLKDLG